MRYMFSGCIAACLAHSASAEDKGMLSGKLYRTQVAAGTEPLVAKCSCKLWMPEGSPVIRCIFVINMRAAGKRLFHRDAEWCAMAARTRSAMMYCEFEAKGVRDNGYGLSMLRACDQFADALKRPELKHAPFILWGHSMGGRVGQDFVRFMPSRVLAFHMALRAHPSTPEFMEEEADAMQVPGLYLMGKEDRKPKDIREHFVRARKNASPRAWIWLPGQSHWPKGMSFTKDSTTAADWKAWTATGLVVPWTEAMIRLRLLADADPRNGPVKLIAPKVENGCLGLIKTGEITPYGEFQGEQWEASWFPNEDVARAWAAFSFPKPSPADPGPEEGR